MKVLSRILSRIHWLNLPGALLVTLLQRTPALSLGELAAERLGTSAIAAVLRPAIALAGSLGALHSLAGATHFVVSSDPITGTVGTPITPAAFTVSGAAAAPGSFKVMSGMLPPGLTITGLDPSTEIVNTDVGAITGTPRSPGKYTVLVRAYQYADAQGPSLPALLGYSLNFVIDGGTGTAPTIAHQPVSHVVAPGTTAVFTIDATGAPLPAYQWSRNNVSIAGATNATLLVSGATIADAGRYTCAVSNTAGYLLSSAANLTVQTTTTPGRLVNLSVRSTAGTGAQTLITGFAIGGAGVTGQIPLLLRGIGPSLAPFGVTGVLADPALSVFQNGAVVASNDNWGGSSAVAARAAQVGAFSLDPASLDSALALSFGSGATTMQVVGAGGTTGVALAEVYDATPAGGSSNTTPRLVNLSARTQVGADAGVLIAGFVIGGTTAKTMLIRATGPTLTTFGVTGVLADPRLDLYSKSTLLSGNDNWGGDPQIAAAAASVGAFAIPDPASKDAALLITLDPGAYTAEVSGADGGSGVGLVEVYEVP